MANFTWEIKRDLITERPRTERSGIAATAALLRTSGGFYLRDGGLCLQFVSESERVAEYFVRLIENVYGARMELREAEYDPKREKDKLTFAYGGARVGRILSDTGFYMRESLVKDGGIPAFVADGEDCALAFIRGAFLGSGSCTLPREGAKTGYHLEFVFSEEETAEQFRDLLAQFEILTKCVSRGDKFVVYLKSLAAISDFLSVTGAESALGKLEEVSARRERSNHVNRASNCAAGNADRTAIASAEQFVAIGKLRENGVLKTLDLSLQMLAQARLENPSLSMGELAGKLGISKSCLSHRMRKLMEIYRKTDKTI